MNVASDLKILENIRAPIVLAIGYFDGVHLGHRAVISRTVGMARKLHGEAWVLTFDPHPMKVLRPETAPPLLTATQHKLQLLERMDLNGCIVLPFTRELSELEPEAFLSNLKDHAPSLHTIVVGKNWRFGHRARGDTALLQAKARTFEFKACIAAPVHWNDAPISSSRIRQAIAQGQLKDAELMLGRPFSILGTVVPGRQVGRELGFPTANLDPHNEVRPPSGIYAAYAVVEDRRYKGAAFLGSRRTLVNSPDDYVVEVHLLDASPSDLYGKSIELVFVDYIREDRRFESREALIRQIATDVEEIRRRLA